MIAKHLLLLGGCSLLAACGDEGVDPPAISPDPDPSLETGLVQDASLTGPGGEERFFDYYVPENLATTPALVIVYHGGRGNAQATYADEAAQSEWLEIADEEGLLVVYPNGTEADTGAPQGESLNWNDCRTGGENLSEADDVGFSLALMDWAQAAFGTNPASVFLTGASNGGMMSMRMAIEQPGRVAGFASFIANEPEPSECAPPADPVPVLLLQATADPLVPFEGGCIAGRNRGCVRSAEATRALWINANGLPPERFETLDYPDLDPRDGSTVSGRAWRDDAGRVRVMTLTVEGGGHQMPSIEHRRGVAADAIVGPQNGDVESARLAWGFFEELIEAP